MHARKLLPTLPSCCCVYDCRSDLLRFREASVARLIHDCRNRCRPWRVTIAAVFLGQRISEKEMTLDVAQRLKSVLAANGYRVSHDPRERCLCAPGNAGRNRQLVSQRNFRICPFQLGRPQRRRWHRNYFYDRDSLPLASAVHHYVAGGAPSPNRGVRRRGYYVLRRARVPAVLVECGFPDESERRSIAFKLFLSPKTRRRDCGRSPRALRASARTTTQSRRVASIPLQSYIDQTKVAKSKSSRSKRSHKKSTRRKKKSRKSAESEANAASKDRRDD